MSSGVVVFVNPDTVVRPGAARALEHALADTTIGAAQARLRLLDSPDLLNSGGNLLHPSGLAWPGGYGEPADALRVPAEIAYPSGAAFGMRTELFRDLGGFTEELFLYQEDLDLGWRLWQRGLRVVVEPAADVLHDYVVERPGRRKEYYLERNRLVFVLTTYSRRLLVLAAPILLAVELGVAIIALREGWAREKLRGWVWLVRERRWLHARRARLQAERVVGDGQLARLFTPAIRLPMVEQPPGLSALNAVLGAWWRLVRVLL